MERQWARPGEGMRNPYLFSAGEAGKTLRLYLKERRADSFSLPSFEENSCETRHEQQYRGGLRGSEGVGSEQALLSYAAPSNDFIERASSHHVHVEYFGGGAIETSTAESDDVSRRHKRPALVRR